MCHIANYGLDTFHDASTVVRVEVWDFDVEMYFRRHFRGIIVPHDTGQLRSHINCIAKTVLSIPSFTITNKNYNEATS